MKPLRQLFLSLVVIASLSIPAYGQTDEAIGLRNIHEPHIDHIEITLPQGLLEGFVVLDQAVSMDEAIDIGLQNNLDVHIADIQTDVHSALLKEAKAKRWPVLGVGSLSFLTGGNSQMFRTPMMMMTAPTNNVFSQEFSAYAKMPLFTGGMIKGGIQANRYALEGSESMLNSTMVNMAFDIRHTYLKALLAQVGHHIHQQHITLQEEVLRIAKVRYKHGKGLKADVLRGYAELADAKQMLNSHHNKLNQAIFQLKTTMGVDLASDIRLSEKLDFYLWEGDLLKALVNQAIENNPSVIEAEKKVLEREAQLKVARSQYFPQVYGQVSGNVRLPDGPPILGNGVVSMFTANLPVFDRNRSAEIKTAQARLLEAQQMEKNVKLQLTRELAQVWSEMTFAKENVSLAKAAVADAQEDLRLMQKRYEVGRAINVEVQDAILTLLQAQLSLAQTVFDHELAKAKLKQALGEVH